MNDPIARLVTAAWLVVSGINFVVWLLVSLISGDLDTPWFLWAFGAGAVVVAVVRLALHGRAHTGSDTPRVTT